MPYLACGRGGCASEDLDCVDSRSAGSADVNVVEVCEQDLKDSYL